MTIPASCRRWAHSRGFTIVEVLMVITIMALLVVLALPAVLNAREATRRSQCAVNQARMALAMGRYDSRELFLPGWRNSLTIDGSPSTVTWLITILPLMERSDIFDGVVRRTVWMLEDYNNANSGHDISWSKCPAVSLLNRSCSYRASGGMANLSRNDGAIWDNDIEGNEFQSLSTVIPPAVPAPTPQAPADPISLSDISMGDGLSTTLLLSESNSVWNWAPHVYTTFVDWATSSPPGPVVRVTPTTPGWVNPRIGNANCIKRPGLIARGRGTFGFPSIDNLTTPLAAHRRVINADLNALSSSHPLGVVVAFADGHTRFLSNELAPHTYGHLLTSRSVFDASEVVTQRYSTNSILANRYLLSASGPGASVPYELKEQDY